MFTDLRHNSILRFPLPLIEALRIISNLVRTRQHRQHADSLVKQPPLPHLPAQHIVHTIQFFFKIRAAARQPHKIYGFAVVLYKLFHRSDFHGSSFHGTISHRSHFHRSSFHRSSFHGSSFRLIISVSVFFHSDHPYALPPMCRNITCAPLITCMLCHPCIVIHILSHAAPFIYCIPINII